MDKKLRWRFAKLVILSWARKENIKNIKDLEDALKEAYSRASRGSSILLDELAALAQEWPVIERGILFLNEEDDTTTFGALTEGEKAIMADAMLQERKKFLKECYRKEN